MALAALFALQPLLAAGAAELQWRRSSAASAATGAPHNAYKADPRVRMVAYAPEEEAESVIVRRSTTAAARGLGLRRQQTSANDIAKPADESVDESFDPFELDEEPEAPPAPAPADPSAESLFDPFDQDDAERQAPEEELTEDVPADEPSVLDDALDAARDAQERGAIKQAPADEEPAFEAPADDELESDLFDEPAPRDVPIQRQSEPSRDLPSRKPTPRRLEGGPVQPLLPSPPVRQRPSAEPKSTLEIPGVEREMTPPQSIDRETIVDEPQAPIEEELTENPLRDEVVPPSTMDEEVLPQDDADDSEFNIIPPRRGLSDADREQFQQWKSQFSGQFEDSPRQPLTPEQEAARREQIAAEQRRAAADCEEIYRALKADTIKTVDLNIRVGGDPGEDYPFDCSLGDETFQPRAWDAITYRWKASGLCHKPLYFEEVQLERYGHTWGPVMQPFVSGAHFFGTVPILPYKMGIETPGECVYTLGHYRPGSCAPRMIEAFPFTWRAAAYEGIVATGLAFIIP